MEIPLTTKNTDDKKAFGSMAIGTVFRKEDSKGVVTHICMKISARFGIVLYTTSLGSYKFETIGFDNLSRFSIYENVTLIIEE